MTASTSGERQSIDLDLERSPQRRLVEPRSPVRDALQRLLRNRIAIIGLVVLAAFGTCALLAPIIAPFPYAEQRLLAAYEGRSDTNPLGTDALGRDMLSRLLFGARISLAVGLGTLTLVLAIGLPLGLVSGYYRGWLDLLLMRLVDVSFAFPNLLLIIIVSAYLGSALPTINEGPLIILKVGYEATGGLLAVFLSLTISGSPLLVRLIRGQVLGLVQREFVLAARAIGATDGRVMRVHLLPNLLPPLIVASILYVPEFIIAEAGLSFIGLGVRPPTPSWGIMLAEGIPALRSYPHVALGPGLAIAVLLLAFNFLGDGLRDALDPTSR